MFSLAEKYGFLLERKFGVGAYDYWWGYTVAQIETAVIDAPLTKYKNDKKGGEKKYSKAKMDAMYDRWKAKRGGRRFAGKTLTPEEIFGNAECRKG